MDHSKTIYDRFYNTGEVKIFLKDDRVIEGTIVNFRKGNPETDEHFIISWSVITKNKEITINQEDIEAVRFK